MSEQSGLSGLGVKPVTTLSYKFQRLRETVRNAIVNGDLTGKLPGERVLAERFGCNAKTLSKALTDLAAEGLLDRSIGRGTFVRPAGTASAVTAREVVGPWLVSVSPREADQLLVDRLRAANPLVQAVVGAPLRRPSFINQFSAVIDLSGDIDEESLRNILVRGIPVVTVGYQPRMYSVHNVICDLAAGAASLTRHVLLEGHRRLLVVSADPSGLLLAVARQHARSFSPTATVDPCGLSDLRSALASGPAAILCDRVELAQSIQRELGGLPQANSATVFCTGVSVDSLPCDGYYVPLATKAGAIIRLISEAQTQRRPVTLWLVPEFMAKGSSASSHSATHRSMTTADGPETASMGQA